MTQRERELQREIYEFGQRIREDESEKANRARQHLSSAMSRLSNGWISGAQDELAYAKEIYDTEPKTLRTDRHPKGVEL